MTPVEPSVDPEAWQLVGVVDERQSWPVTTRQIHEYLAAADDWNPLYCEADAAASGPYGELVAPPLFVLAASRRVQPRRRLLDDGQYDDLTIPGVNGRSVLASWDIEVLGLLRAGDVVTVREAVTGIEEKQGRSGPLVIVTKESTHTNQRDEKVAVETQTIIYR